MTEPLLLGLTTDIQTGQQTYTVCRGPEAIAHGMTRETAEEIMVAMEISRQVDAIITAKPEDHEEGRKQAWLKARLDATKTTSASD
jgi:hypothetical protein